LTPERRPLTGLLLPTSDLHLGNRALGELARLRRPAA
jgi:hypothetical protein